MNSIKIGSINCRGLASDSVTRRDVFLRCRTKYDISLLIDTHSDKQTVRLGYCFTPYPRLWLYNGAPLVVFYDTLGIRRTYSRLKPPASSRGTNKQTELLWKNEWVVVSNFDLIPQTAEEWRFYLKIRFNTIFTTK